ncbi:MAG TPA: hypothetical protein VGK04_08985 [Thermoanaerobaculia bacterium]
MQRAGASIVLVAAAVTAVFTVALIAKPSWRFGWIREPFVWVYIGALWLGGAKVLAGTLRPIAEVDGGALVLRPLHQFRQKIVPWGAVRGTEQTIGGDRLIIYYETPRGMRFVALNLNLVKGRRDFLRLLEERLAAMGFVEKIVERSRYLSRPA